MFIVRHVTENVEAPVPELRPLGVGEILDVSIKLYTRHFRTLLAIVALVVVPVELLLVPVVASALPDPALLRPQLGLTPEPVNVSERDLGRFLTGSAVSAVFAIIATLLAQAAAFQAVREAYLGQRPDWRRSLRFMVRRLHSVLWISILALVLLFLALLAGGIVTGIVAALAGGGGPSIAIVSLGVATLITGLVWLGVSWALPLPALMVERLRGRRALGRSFRLVRGRWWPTFAAIGLGFGLALVVQLVATGLLQALLFTDIGENAVAAVVISQLGNAVGASLATPIQAAIVAVVYFDLRVRKEGFDLELLAERVGEGSATRERPR